MQITPDNDANQPFNVDSTKCVAAGIFMGVMGGEVFIVQPGFVQGLVEYAHFSEQQAGFVASAEMSGFAVVTLLIGALSGRLPWQRVLAVWGLTRLI